ncbi:hypothetical protein [Amycolatopsis suaedae]|uniref:WXG100 family type VII secretion target n=1 Tax=Amycolatopsis suaedae TaxID=2510978 RepID=A0A4Q7J9X0_9PSEU|nr:hypothetical protein [Amycolatopsis suaedae]RZQ63702.1 hypothetical protein EWH70_11020 [Amycolatopsis suaedae]
MTTGIQVNPDILRAGAQNVVNSVVAHLQAQRQSYQEAYDLVSSRVFYWTGGHGGSGRMPDAGDKFLNWLAGMISAKITELDSFISGLQTHSANMIELADRTHGADLRATETLNKIARGLDGLGV